MELSSHVVANLDQWVENGFISVEQREAFAQLMENAVQDAYEYGLTQSDNDGGYDDGYDNGYDDAQAGWESKRDEWFDQGYEAALAEHGIEE
jgi:hypothetical protein